MLERIRLENFKASRDLDNRLAPLTILAGLNSSGKSTLLQAVASLRQSYEPNGRTMVYPCPVNSSNWEICRLIDRG